MVIITTHHAERDDDKDAAAGRVDNDSDESTIDGTQRRVLATSCRHSDVIVALVT